MWIEQVSQIGNRKINRAVGPANGPPLVFLHGVARCWRDFVPVLQAFASRWQAHSLDLRGHGGSERCPREYRVLDYACDVAAYLETELGEPAVLYGHSLGALVACAVASQVPQRVRAVALEDPPAATLLRDIRQTPFFRFFSGLRELAGSESSVAEIARQLGQMSVQSSNGESVRLSELRDATSLRFSARCLRDLDAEVMTPLLQGRWLEGADWERTARGIRCPTLLLRADEACGGMLPRADADQLGSWLADCDRVDFPGTGHLIHWLETDKTVRYVTGFLESLR